MRPCRARIAGLLLPLVLGAAPSLAQVSHSFTSDTWEGLKLITRGSSRAIKVEGSGALNNDHGEVVATGNLLNVDSRTAIKGVRNTRFRYKPTRLSVTHPVSTQPLTLAAVSFDGADQWLLEDDNFLFLMDFDVDRDGVAVQVLLTESLSRASLIKLPAGEFVIFGHKVRASRNGARVAFVRGTPSDCVGCSVEPYGEVVSIKGRSEDDLKRGCDRGVSQDCLGLYKLLCENRNYAGCFNLGRRYASGKDVSRDLAGAAMLFKAACDNWVPSDLIPPSIHAGTESCFSLGFLYMNGEDLVVAKDPNQARFLFDKACQDGDGQPKACTSLGFLYAKGQGVAKKPLLAIRLYQMACDNGDPTGCFNLGVMYEYGQDVTKDPVRAADFYKRACGYGHQQGCEGQQRLAAHPPGIPNPFRITPLRITPPTVFPELLFPFVEKPSWDLHSRQLTQIALEDPESQSPIVFFDAASQRDLPRVLAILYDENGMSYAYDNKTRTMSVYAPLTRYGSGGSQHIHPDAVIEPSVEGWKIVAGFFPERKYDVMIRAPKIIDGRWQIPAGQPPLATIKRTQNQSIVLRSDGLLEAPHYFRVYPGDEESVAAARKGGPLNTIIKAEIRSVATDGKPSRGAVVSKSTYDRKWYAQKCEEYGDDGTLINLLERPSDDANVPGGLLAFRAQELLVSGVASEEIAKRFPRGGSMIALAGRQGASSQVRYVVLADEDKRPVLAFKVEREPGGQTVTYLIEGDGGSVRSKHLGGLMVSPVAGRGVDIKLGKALRTIGDSRVARLPECVWPPWPAPLWRSISR